MPINSPNRHSRDGKLNAFNRLGLREIVSFFGTERPRRAAKRLLSLERLEVRLNPSNYTVTSLAYSGAGTLSDAIHQAVASHDSSADITFSGIAPNSTIHLSAASRDTTPTGSTGSLNVSAKYGPTAYAVIGSGVAITIDGSSAPGLTIDGGNAVRLFLVGQDGWLLLKDLTLSGGFAQGGRGGDGQIDGVDNSIHNMTGGTAGGGGAGLGGGVFVDGASFLAEGCTFVNNAARGGNGGNTLRPGDPVVPYSGHGGGLLDTTGGMGFGMGGDAGTPSKALNFAHTDGRPGGNGGFGGGGGGGGGASTQLSGELIFHTGHGGNGGFGGGGGGNGYSILDIPGDGYAGAPGFGGGYGGGGGGGAGLGGGIFSNQGFVNLQNNTFYGNTATGGTGGLIGDSAFRNGKIVDLFDSQGPEADGKGLGGAVFSRNGQVNAFNNTFNHNVASTDATCVYALGDTTDGGNNTSPANGGSIVSLINNIMVGNSHANDSPGQSPSTLNDVLWGTNGAGANIPVFDGSYNNLVGMTPAFLSGGLPPSAVVSSADPLLGSLSFNGGSTQTMAVAPGTPADGLGDGNAQLGGFALDITTDQRGNARPPHSTLGSYQVAPTVTFGSSGLDLGPIVSGTAGQPVTFSLSGTNLFSTVTVTAPQGVELSTDGNNWTNSFTFSPTDGVVTGTILEARLRLSSNVGTFNGVISATGSGLAELDLPVTASVRVGLYVTSAQASIPVTGSDVFTFTRVGGDLQSPLTESFPLDISTTVPAGYTLSGGNAVINGNALTVTFPGGGVSSMNVTFRPAPNPTGMAENSHGFAILSDSGITSVIVQANGLLVNNNLDNFNDGSLRQAVYNALAMGGSSTIAFASSLAGQTILLGGTDYHAGNSYGSVALAVVGGANLTIDGSNAPGLVIDGQNQQRLLVVTPGSSLTLKNLTLQNGHAQGLNGNVGLSGGGGGGGGAGLGGAVFNDAGSFTAVGCTFTNNSAQGGQGGVPNTGGAFGGIGGTGGSLGLGAPGAGPGGNRGGGNAGFGGGGGGAGFGNGGAGGFGGGGGGAATPVNAQGGPRGFGGAAGGVANYFNLQGIQYHNGGVGGGGAGLGGGIFSNGGAVTLINDTFTANTATGGGGGVGAAAKGLGGAVFIRNGTLNAIYDTFSGNSAAAGGTSLYVLSDSSDGGNNSNPGTGSATATLIDDILGQADNTVADFLSSGYGAGAAAPDMSGSKGNLVRNNPAAGGLPSSAVFSNADPMLSALANNGGPTPTMAIGPQSPAAEVLFNPSQIGSDQRGISRPPTPSAGAYQVPGTFSSEATSLDLGTATYPIAGNTVPFSFNGFLIHTITSITAPAGVQLSLDGGINWSSSWSIWPSADGSLRVAGAARLSGNGPYGQINNPIRITSLGSKDLDIAIHGLISQATPTITLTGTSAYYDGTPKFVNVTGSAPASSGQITVSYTENGLPVASPTDVGVYFAKATFTSTDPNYADVTVSRKFLITPRQTTTTLTSSVSGPIVYGQHVVYTATVTPFDGSTAVTGYVEFLLDYTPGGTISKLARVRVSGGIATYSTIGLPQGVHSVTALYVSNSDFFEGSSSSSVTQEVDPASVAIALTDSAIGPVAYGTPINLSATVTNTSGSTPIPMGSVNFYDGQTLLGGVILLRIRGGVATFSTSNLAVNVSHNLTAVFTGTNNFLTATSAAISQTVVAARTSTVASVSASSITYGQAATLSATVTNLDSASTPSGWVDFYSGKLLLGRATVASNGIATFSTSTLPVGSLQVTANYEGNTNFQQSVTSSGLPFNVTPATTSATIASSSPNSIAGQPVTLTATVTNASTSLIPIGNLTFYLDYGASTQKTIGTASLVNGVATFTAPSGLPLGTHTVTGIYLGNANFPAATSAAISQMVVAARTSTAASISTSSTTYGQAVTLSAIVTNLFSASTPSGRVDFYSGNLLLGYATIASNGIATLSTSTLPAGSLQVTAKYEGNSSFPPSVTSSSLPLNVTPATTSATIASSSTNSIVGQPVTFTATVTNASTSLIPIGDVTFYMDYGASTQKTIGTASLVNGVATFTVPNGLPLGTHTVTGIYLGNGNFLSANSASLVQTVVPAATTTLLTSSPSLIVPHGSSVRLTATVLNINSAVIPTGVVRFYDGTTLIGTGTLDSSGIATISVTLSGSTFGKLHPIKANYVGGSNLLGSLSNVLPLLVF